MCPEKGVAKRVGDAANYIKLLSILCHANNCKVESSLVNEDESRCLHDHAFDLGNGSPIRNAKNGAASDPLTLRSQDSQAKRPAVAGGFVTGRAVRSSGSASPIVHTRIISDCSEWIATLPHIIRGQPHIPHIPHPHFNFGNPFYINASAIEVCWVPIHRVWLMASAMPTPLCIQPISSICSPRFAAACSGSRVQRDAKRFEKPVVEGLQQGCASICYLATSLCVAMCRSNV